jgi:hypothetical protein
VAPELHRRLFLPWSLHYLSRDVTASVVELAKSRGRFGLAPKALGVPLCAPRTLTSFFKLSRGMQLGTTCLLYMSSLREQTPRFSDAPTNFVSRSFPSNALLVLRSRRL